jgi:hypothetical protein
LTAAPDRTVREQRVGHGDADDQHQGVAILRHERPVACDVAACDFDAGLRLPQRQGIGDASLEPLPCQLVCRALAVERPLRELQQLAVGGQRAIRLRDL